MDDTSRDELLSNMELEANGAVDAAHQLKAAGPDEVTPLHARAVGFYEGMAFGFQVARRMVLRAARLID